MKKSTKKTLMALSIMLVFGLSSVAFVVGSSFGATQSDTSIEPLTSYVIDGEINPQVEAAYIQGGFTFVKAYYNHNMSQEVMDFVSQTPELFQTPNRQTEIVAQRIFSSQNYVKIVNTNGEENILDPTPEKIYDELCLRLVVQPTECAIGALSLSG